MTVTYSLDVSSSRLFTFGKLLFRWRGSVFKLLWRETLAFVVLYYALSFAYRFALDDERKRIFERFCLYCELYTQYAPLSFILGFYLSIVYSRWWGQWEAISWPDKMAILVCTFVRGDDYRGRLIRRTLMRYLNLASVLGFRIVSSAVLKRFPSMPHLVEAGFITESELAIFNNLVTPHPRYWLPCQWAANLLYAARQEGRIGSNRELIHLVQEVNDFNFRIKKMTAFNWISVPIAYTQVVTLGVYSYFLACLFGKQFLDSTATSGQDRDVYFPLFTIIQLAFYMGWMKTAEVLINPYGEDDDDFEVNFIVERNLQLSYNNVDDAFGLQPPLEQDLHWNEHDPRLPHTVASIGLKDHGYFGSTLDIRIPLEQADVLLVEPQSPTEQDVGRLQPPHRLRQRVFANTFGTRLKGSMRSMSVVDPAQDARPERKMTRKRLTSCDTPPELERPHAAGRRKKSNFSDVFDTGQHRRSISAAFLTKTDEEWLGANRDISTKRKSNALAADVEQLLEAEVASEKDSLLEPSQARVAGRLSVRSLGVIMEDVGNSRSPSVTDSHS